MTQIYTLELFGKMHGGKTIKGRNEILYLLPVEVS